jgi:hypothetical protein
MQPSTASTTARRSDSLARWAACIRGSFPIAAVAVAVLSGPGCKQGSKLAGKQEKPDLLESELRTREREILEARSENQQLRGLLDAYQRQGVPCANPGVAVAPGFVPHNSNSIGPALREIILGTGTGGRDDNNTPGDEGLMVVIVPKDDDGTAVKATGQACITAMEISKEGLKSPIGKWDVSAEQLRRTWKSGLLSSGYFVPLQWDRPPGTDRLRVSVRFTTPDGRSYETDKDVKVTPLAGWVNPVSPGPIIPNGPGIVVPPPAIPPEEILPPPSPSSFKPGAALAPVVSQ